LVDDCRGRRGSPWSLAPETTTHRIELTHSRAESARDSAVTSGLAHQGGCYGTLLLEWGVPAFGLTLFGHMNTACVSLDPQELQDLLDELERSRQSRRRAWKNLQEIRWVLKNMTGIELPAAPRKTIDLEGRKKTVCVRS